MSEKIEVTTPGRINPFESDCDIEKALKYPKSKQVLKDMMKMPRKRHGVQSYSDLSMHSIAIVRGKVKKHDGTTLDIKSGRMYIKKVENEEALTLALLKLTSMECIAIMVGFLGKHEPFHIEVDVYVNTVDVSKNMTGIEWSRKPCSIELSKDKYYDLIAEMMRESV